MTQYETDLALENALLQRKLGLLEDENCQLKDDLRSNDTAVSYWRDLAGEHEAIIAKVRKVVVGIDDLLNYYP